MTRKILAAMILAAIAGAAVSAEADDYGATATLRWSYGGTSGADSTCMLGITLDRAGRVDGRESFPLASVESAEQLTVALFGAPVGSRIRGLGDAEDESVWTWDWSTAGVALLALAAVAAATDDDSDDRDGEQANGSRECRIFSPQTGDIVSGCDVPQDLMPD